MKVPLLEDCGGQIYAPLLETSGRHTSTVVVRSRVRDYECRRDLNLAEGYASAAKMKQAWLVARQVEPWNKAPQQPLKTVLGCER